jgi:protein TonB
MNLGPPQPPVTPPVATPAELPQPVTEAPPTDGSGSDNDASGERDGRDNGSKGGSGDSTAGVGDEGGAGPVVITAEMTRPVLLSKVEPVYPEIPRIARMSGKVTLQAVIGLDGRVESVNVIASTSGLFNDAALDAVRQWRYTPALMNGRPVRIYFTVAVEFVLR